MSKKRRKHKITLEIGKFYRVQDGSPGGHPGQIYKIDNDDKAFYAIVTGSMSEDEFKRLGLRKGYYKLKHPTDQNVDISLMKKSSEISHLVFSDEDSEAHGPGTCCTAFSLPLLIITVWFTVS